MGNTAEVMNALVPDEDHPHTCGEYTMNLYELEGSLGSPPHMWGILVSGACGRCLRWDHPHTCGEYTKESLIYQHFRLEKTANFITLTIKAYPTHT